MARTTLAAKLPDLDVLKLLRSAEVTLTEEAVEQLDGVLPMPASHDASKWAPLADRAVGGRPADNSDIIPLPVSPPLAPAVAAPEIPAGPPPEFLTTVSFTPPGSEHCWSCAEALPTNRPVKFCPFCGADQRQPTCPACTAPVERRWKHCPECGIGLAAGPA
jgi:hypothetical protein